MYDTPIWERLKVSCYLKGYKLGYSINAII